VPRVRPTPLGELGAALGRPVEGDPTFVVRGVAPLARAGAGDLSFVRSSRFARVLEDSGAGALVAPPGLDTGGRPTLRTARPDLDFARALGRLCPPERPAPGVHPAAVVADDAHVDPSACVGPRAVVGARTRVGPRSVLHAGAVVYPDVRVGADCVLHAGCVVREETEIGDRVVLHPGVVIGADGFGYTLDEGGRPLKVPQVGRVVLEDDVEIGANATVDRAALGETRVRRNAKIDDLVMVSHNCDIGEDVLIAAQSGLAGSTTIGRGAILMGQTGSAGHLVIGAGSILNGRAAVHRDLPPGSRVWGAPPLEERRWHRSMAALARLPEALRRLRALERRLGVRGGPEGGTAGDEGP
jgi:UDP-3-O-[3-hydroxymyristoyl] glucosamine N-acyltransferase